MKIYLTYDQLRGLANNVVAQLREKYAEPIKNNKLFLFAVARGGLTFGQLVAYKMALPLGVMYPMPGGKQSTIVHPFCEDLTYDDKAVFVYLEDVVAQGRTLEKVLSFHAALYGDKIVAEFVPVVLDSNVDPAIRSRVNIAGMITSDWIVFPHEEIDHVIEGDRGLFRESTSRNSVPIE